MCVCVYSNFSNPITGFTSFHSSKTKFVCVCVCSNDDNDENFVNRNRYSVQLQISLIKLKVIDIENKSQTRNWLPIYVLVHTHTHQHIDTLLENSVAARLHVKRFSVSAECTKKKETKRSRLNQFSTKTLHMCKGVVKLLPIIENICSVFVTIERIKNRSVFD